MPKVYLNDMPIKEYHAKKDFTGSTGAKIAYQSMFEYLQYLNDEDKDSEAKKFGRVYHTVMEGKDFSKSFAILDPDRRPEPDKTMASNANKEWKAIVESNAVNNGLEVCSKVDYDQAMAMRKVLDLYVKNDSNTGEETKMISSILEQAIPEMSLFCDDYLGCKVKARPDISLPFLTLDFKSVKSITPVAIQRAILDYGWDIQIALYSDLCAMYYDNLSEVPDRPLYPFFILAQCKKEPYDFTLYNVSGFYYGGKAKLIKALDNIKSGVMKGCWGLIPHDALGIVLNPPSWAYKDLGVAIPPDEQESLVVDDGFEYEEIDDDGGEDDVL